MTNVLFFCNLHSEARIKADSSRIILLSSNPVSGFWERVLANCLCLLVCFLFSIGETWENVLTGHADVKEVCTGRSYCFGGEERGLLVTFTQIVELLSKKF